MSWNVMLNEAQKNILPVLWCQFRTSRTSGARMPRRPDPGRTWGRCFPVPRSATEPQNVSDFSHKVLPVEFSSAKCLYIEVWINVIHETNEGERGSAVAWDTMLQAGGSRFRFPMRSLDFSIALIIPATLWPWGLLNLRQNWVSVSSAG
jgi:hypothetical protein